MAQSDDLALMAQRVGLQLPALRLTREARGEEDALITRPAIGEAVAREPAPSLGDADLASRRTVPVHRLGEIEDDAGRVAPALKGIALHAYTGQRRQLDADLIGLERHGIVARPRLFAAMAEACVHPEVLFLRLPTIVQRGQQHG